MENIRYKTFDPSGVEIKEDAGRMYVSGFASIFGNVDSYGDVVEKGAFIATLQKDAARVKFCKNHEIKTVIGKPIEIKEEDRGLYFNVRMGRTSEAKEAGMQIEDGEMNEFSIGYIPVKYENITLANGRPGRKLTEVKLIEISLVSRAANPAAVVTSISRKSEEIQRDIKSMSDLELTQLKMAIGEEYSYRVLKSLTNQQ